MNPHLASLGLLQGAKKYEILTCFRLKVRELLHAVGKKCGVDASVIDALDLENVVERTIAMNVRIIVSLIIRTPLNRKRKKEKVVKSSINLNVTGGS